jgi:hypothetical protein
MTFIKCLTSAHHCRTYELVDEDDPLDAATTSSPVSPKETDTWVKRFVLLINRLLVIG